uniref:Polynucleotide adenylyltransferase region n=1 Tax=Leptospirillum ferrodiazotrophum TaxID=412449 RepID=C6HYY5_9BACT|nr:MAG: Polynucleotide adenylyltransferase region [Leptospirillum ferrodiazotrophum]
MNKPPGGEGAENVRLGECLPLLAPLFRAGIPVWLVGGAVRDLREGRVPRDLDFVAEAEVECLRRYLPKAVPVGGKNSTLVLSLGKGRAPLEISGAGRGIHADLERRDFSVNAMAWRVAPAGLEGEILDPFGGREDLGKGILRVPLASRDPFREDPVRILRLLRFVSTRGYGVEGWTLSMARGALDALPCVAGERRLREIALFWEGTHLARVRETLPEDFCGRALGAGIFGKRLLPLSVEKGEEAYVRAVDAKASKGLVRMWIFAREAAGPEGGVETRWGRSLWRGGEGSDLPFSRRERQFLVALDRLRDLLGFWPAAGPPDPRRLAVLGRDPSREEVARWVAEKLPAECQGRFWQWMRQEERLGQRLSADGVRSLPRHRR